MRADEIRSRFVGYFERRGHVHLPSGPLVPPDDPTLMFTNAGMVQFKAVFLGEADRPSERAVTAQKCLRVSGKHNDLEEVGRTERHHTFFEMLGNFSFGDYFKRDAILFAWEFVTQELGLDPARLWATVHRTDDEAFRLWGELTPLPESRIRRLGDKDNFWQMGDTGPCGPCSELHYDKRDVLDDRITDAQFEAAGDADRFMEIWNLVFMQFDRGPGGVDTPLPAPSIDTGAGLERIAALLQGVGTSFHIDTFRPIIQTAEDALEREYSFAPEDWEAGLPFRVLADHARAVAFLLADGVFPSNEKRGYVLRRILRRAVRHYWLLGRREPMLDSLVGVVAEGMRDTYPELDSRREHLLATTRSEEELFLDTIEGGMAEIDLAMPERVHGAEPRKPERSGPIVISGATVFKLKDTYGIPEDLTGVIADERGYEVDWEGFETALEEQRRRSRAAAEGAAIIAARTGTPLVAEGQQEFVGYDRVECESAILVVRRLEDGYEMVLERNPFYAESGGQVSDRGWIRGEDWTIEVTGVYKNDGGQTVVAGPLSGGALPPDPELVTASVHTVLRRDTERNHTATHLLHAALRELLGEHVQQAGSLVAPDRLRFDFSHRGPLTSAERDAIEQRVNERILANLDVTATERDYGEALAEGAMALFGEKYGDVVRVIDVPGISIELCGGTHVRTTGQIGSFRILSETGVAAGIRRIEAISGTEAYRRAVRQDLLIADLAARLRVPVAELPTRLDRLLDELDELERDAVGRRGAAAADQVQRLIDDTPRDGARFLSGRIEVPAGTDLGELGDLLRERLGSGAAILHVVYPDEDRHAFLSVVSDDLVRDGIKAGDLVRVSSKATGSGGGGRPHFAHGGVGDPEQADAGLVAARDWVSERAPNLVG